ncbi:MAG: phage minor head protein [Verrucomicrobiota bacterium]
MADAPSNFLLDPVPNDEARKWMESKPVVSRDVFDELLPELKARAFMVTGLEDANVAREIRDTIAKLPAGEDYEELKKTIAEKLGPWFDEDAAKQRAELLMRQHGFQAYRTLSRATHDRQAGVFTYRQYLSMDDSRVRPSHRAMHGMVLPANSPFWLSHPGGFGCRCDEVPLLPDERDDIEAEDATLPPEEKRIIDGARLAKLENEGRLIRAVKGPDGKPIASPLHEWNVSNPSMVGAPSSLRINPDELKARYDADTWNEFEGRAKKNQLDDGRTVWDWMNGAKAPKVKAKASKAPKGSGKAPPATPAPAALLPPAGSAKGTPLTGKLDTAKLSKAEQDRVTDVLGIIDSVHGDGPLDLIPVGNSPGKDALGAFFYSAGKAKRIDYLHKTPSKYKIHPELTLAHEIGHWLDKSGKGQTGWATDDLGGELQEWWKAAQESEAFKGIEALPQKTFEQAKTRAYYLKPKEVWARSYAQFIAEESGDATMLGQVAKIRGEPIPTRQWDEADFAPVKNAIRELFVKRGWKEAAP